MKKLLLVVVVVSTMILALSGCQSAKQVAYFQNIDSLNLSASRMLYDAKIMPKDQLSIITVITTDPKAAMPFNLAVSNTIGTSRKQQVLQQGTPLYRWRHRLFGFGES